MRLGQLAWALGVNEKTADNAIRTLGLSRPVEVATARALGLALRLKHRYGIPLKRAFPLVREAMVRPAMQEEDAVVREILAYLPQVDRGIQSAARYEPLPRGPGWRDPYHPAVPPRHRRHPAIRRAIRWGLDLSLNYAALRQPPGQRLLELSANEEAIRALREAVQRKQTEPR